MLSPNKKLNIILGFVSLAFIVASIIMWTIISRREETRNYFKFDSISNIKWISEENEFRIDKDSVRLTINNEDLVNDRFDSFETDSGKINAGNKTLYLRSVSSSNLVIWYDNVEYKFIKYVEAK